MTSRFADGLGPDVCVRQASEVLLLQPELHRLRRQADLLRLCSRVEGFAVANRSMTVADISTVLAQDLKTTGGSRFMSILKMACRLQQQGVSQAIAWKFLNRAAHQCRPPYSRAATLIVLKHAYRERPFLPWRTAL